MTHRKKYTLIIILLFLLIGVLPIIYQEQNWTEVSVEFFGGKSEQGLFTDKYYTFVKFPQNNTYFLMSVSSSEFEDHFKFKNGYYITNGSKLIINDKKYKITQTDSIRAE